MIRALLITLLLTLVSNGAQAIGSPETMSPSEIVAEAQALVQDYDKLAEKKGDIYYKYLLATEHIGPIQFKQLNMSDLSQITKDYKVQLTDITRQRFRNWEEAYDPKKYNFQGLNKRTLLEARNIVRSLQSFATSIDGQMGYQLLMRYESDGYSIRRSLKSRMLHLPTEIGTFAAALVIVRVATCFGGSTQSIIENITRWQTPKLRASNIDPICVDEIAEMLKSPVFYAGFSAFVAGSAVANAATLKVMKAFDPDNASAWTRSFEKNWLPNIGLAVGFISDHLVKTLIENKYLQECAKVAVPDTFKSTGQLIKNTVIARDDNGQEGFEVIDYYSSFKGLSCRKAARSLSSDEFLKEQMGVGVGSLVAAAVATAKVTQYSRGAVQTAKSSRLVRGAVSAAKSKVRKAIQLAKDLKMLARLEKFTLGVSLAGGPVTIAMRLGSMVLFLGISEVITPIAEEAYMEAVVKPSVDKKTEAFNDETQFKAKLEQQAQTLVNESIASGDVPLLPQKICSEQYSGFLEDGSTGVCSRLPFLASINTFHDYSRTWRQKHILKEFYMGFGRWQRRLTSFINNYMMSMTMMNTLTRSREMFVNYQKAAASARADQEIPVDAYISESEKLDRDKLENKIQKILKDNFSEQERQSNLDYIKSEYQKTLNDGAYKSALASLPLTDPRRQIFDTLSSLDYQDFLLQTLPYGTPFNGLFGSDQASVEQINNLVVDIMTFIGDQKGNTFIEIQEPATVQIAKDPNQRVASLLKDLGMPLDFIYSYNLVDLKSFFESDDIERNALGLLLFQEWMPNMWGPLNKMDEKYQRADGRSQNPRGMMPKQYQLYKKITAALKDYSPRLSWELLVLMTSYADLSQHKKTTEDLQFTETNQKLSTENLMNYTLTQLLCGQNSNKAEFFGDHGGVALQFEFPHLMEKSLCEQVYLPIHMGLWEEPLPSPLRSVFVAEEGFYIGLHKAYITAPVDFTAPLLFNSEQEAGDWWNSEVRPKSLARLQQLKEDYVHLSEESFYSKIQDDEIDSKSWIKPVWTLVGKLFGGYSKKERQKLGVTSTNSLTLSLTRELQHYQKALNSLMTEAEAEQINPLLNKSAQCLVQLMNSIPEKKYRVTRQGCESTLENVRSLLLTPGGRYNSSSAQSDFRKMAEDKMTPQQRKDRVLMAFSEKIEGLFVEVEHYNEMANESFQFDLKKGDNQ